MLNAPDPDENAAREYQVPTPDAYEVEAAPDSIDDVNDLQAWRELFEERKEWAQGLYEDCAAMTGQAEQRYQEIHIIMRAIRATVLNLNGHITSLENKFDDPRNSLKHWAQQMITDYDQRIKEIDKNIQMLRMLPASPSMMHFIDNRYPANGSGGRTLVDLLSTDEVYEAKALAVDALHDFKSTHEDFAKNVKKICTGMDRVAQREQESAELFANVRHNEPAELLHDIKVLVTKIANDYGTLMSYPNDAKSAAQASRTALLHTRNFIPSLKTYCVEMHNLLVGATDLRNNAVLEQTEILQGVGTLNALISVSNSRVDSLNFTEDEQTHQALDLLLFADRLPVLYASLIAEAIRRREWSEKIKTDSSALANEMAEFQDEESKRRKNWQKSTGAFFWQDRKEDKVPGLEFNLLSNEDVWPAMTRQDLEKLIIGLRDCGANDDTIAEVSKILEDLSAPTKQQAKRARAFKNGSFHEAALGRSMLLTRGDNDSMQDMHNEKTRLAAKLKGAESRVRKLESLLHHQSQSARTSVTSNAFCSAASPDEDGTHVGSPLARDGLSRTASMASKRFSTNKSVDEKAYTQKIINLESDLLAERERAAGLEKEAAAKTSTIRDLKMQVDDANSTKKDLMRNLEAQQREFGAERKSLEDDNRKLKVQLEDYEDSIDRVIGSRENKEIALDEQIQDLNAELEKVKNTSKSDVEKAQGQVDFLRDDAQRQRETNELLEKQATRMREEIRDLKKEAQRGHDGAIAYSKTLQDMYFALFQDHEVPDDLAGLTERCLSRIRDMIAHMDVHARDLLMAQADSDSKDEEVKAIRRELAAKKEQSSEAEIHITKLTEELAQDKAKYSALEKSMTEHQEQLVGLRAKFAEGETGSGELRNQLEQAEKTVTSLKETQAASQTQLSSLQSELKSTKDRLSATEKTLVETETRFEGRTFRVRNLTQRLYAQVDRLLRLLDRLNYSVTNENGQMIITKIPRSERQNNDSDPSASMRRSVSGLNKLPSSQDLDFLSWQSLSHDTFTETSLYERFLQSIDTFDVEVFCETIVKRLKDTEHTARKATRDARMYREKSHQAQKESHEKIAYKAFREGDLALFLPTRNQSSGAWAAFNVGAPHYFLREQDSHKLRTRDWLLARIQRVEDRVVDLSRSMTSHDSRVGEAGSLEGDSIEDDNPFDLSDGLRWYLLDAVEEKQGIPILAPSIGKSTVSATNVNVEATGSLAASPGKGKSLLGKAKGSAVDNISKTLSRSLESRRSSNNSKRGSAFLGKKGPESVVEDSAGEGGHAAAPPPRASLDKGKGKEIVVDTTPTTSQPQGAMSPPPLPLSLTTAGSGVQGLEVGKEDSSVVTTSTSIGSPSTFTSIIDRLLGA